jgi:uncharacterized protein with HEPN domain
MNKKSNWKLYAIHILDCIEKIRTIQKRGDISEDVILYDATLRNLQTLSESTMHLPKNLTQEYTIVPWKQISGFRNILVHDYLGDIDPITIQRVINEHLPTLEAAIKSMLEQR